MGTTANTFMEYIEIINREADELQRDLIRNEKLLFRGHADSSYQLLPSIARKRGRMDVHSLLWFEKEMVEGAVGKLPEVLDNQQYPINLLTKLQHYGLPTRLLDVTYNALVALYFACSDKSQKEKDGEVIVFHLSSDKAEYVYSYNSGLVNVIANMYKIGKLDACTLTRFLKVGDFDRYIEFNMDELKERDVTAYQQRIMEWIGKPLFISPAEMSERQKRQQGAFIIFPNEYRRISETDQYFAGNIQPLNKGESPVVKQITIPGDSKKNMLKYLETYGITEEFLFPDSVDIVCKSIKDNAMGRLG